MLKKPTRPLPRQFNRPVTPGTRSFVERRHRRAKARSSERWKRWMRRWRSAAVDRLSAARRWMKFIVVGLAVFMVCLLLFSPILRVREIRVVRSEGRINLAGVMQSLAPLYGRHLLFVSTRDIDARVRAAVPDASEISVSKTYPSSLYVRISVEPLVAKLLVESAPGVIASTGSGSKTPPAEFLTANGLLVVGAKPSQPLPSIRLVDWGVRPAPLSRVIDPDTFERMRRAEDTLAREFSQQIVLRTIYMRAQEFHLDTASVSFWFDMRSPLQDQLQRLRTFLKNAKLQDAKQYVDLRIIGKVIYK